jgi:hypothetical protein
VTGGAEQIGGRIEGKLFMGIRTLCHYCGGTGSIGLCRAADLPDYEFDGGYQFRDCPTCGGRRWLSGVQPPA